MKKIIGYDVIGDIHGQNEKLEQLLIKMDYKKIKGTYQHENRKVVFLGDFVDRGVGQKKTIDIVRPMIENNHAVSIMGNHELNAILFHTNHPETGEPLRSHSTKNVQQHEAFLKDYPLGGAETQSVINWFKTLPIYLELNELRAIHACWDKKLIERIQPQLTDDNKLTDELLVKSTDKTTEEYEIIETLLKGPELPLPDGQKFYDKDGVGRRNVRCKWWESDLKTYFDIAVVPNDMRHMIPKIPLDKTTMTTPYPANDLPIFFGHYWFSGDPTIIRDNVTCMDYSAGKGGALVSYRLDIKDKGQKLSNQNFISTDIQPKLKK